MPDLVFFLKVDPQTGLARLDREGDRLEGEDATFHERVSIGYRKLAKQFPDRFVAVDATKSPAEIHEEVVAVLEERASDRLPGGAEAAASTTPR